MPRVGMPVLRISASSWSFRLGRRLRMEGASSPPAPSPPWHAEQWLSYSGRPGSAAGAGTGFCASMAQSGSKRVTKSFGVVIKLASSVLAIVEAVSQNCLHQQMVGGLRHAHADAEVELPVLAEIDIHGRQNLLLLVAQRVESRHRAIGSVILHAHRHFLGDVVAELEIG